METNLRLQGRLNNFDNTEFNVRVWRDRYNNHMIVVGYYCFCNEKFRTHDIHEPQNLILSESTNGSMLAKAQELRNIYLNKEL